MKKRAILLIVLIIIVPSALADLVSDFNIPPPNVDSSTPIEIPALDMWAACKDRSVAAYNLVQQEIDARCDTAVGGSWSNPDAFQACVEADPGYIKWQNDLDACTREFQGVKAPVEDDTLDELTQINEEEEIESSLPVVESLLEAQPMENDINLDEAEEVYVTVSMTTDPQGITEKKIIILGRTHDVNIELPDGSTIHPGTKEVVVVPIGSVIRTGPDEYLKVAISSSSIMHVSPNSRIKFSNIDLVGGLSVGRFIVEGGSVRFDTKSALRIASPSGIGAGTRGTDFGVGFIIKTQETIVEIYDGEIEVEIPNGENQVLSSRYDDQIKRLTVASDGTFVKQIAVPRKQLADQENKNGEFIWFIAILVVIGVVGFFVWKRRHKG